MRLKVVYTVHERNADGSYGSSTTHVARTASGVSRPASSSEDHEKQDNPTTATTFLKSCLALICFTRPDLIPDANTDYSVSVLDIAESAAAGGNARVFEGQGMMGWILAEQNAGVTCIVGKLQKPAVTGNSDSADAPPSAAEEVLEVVLELKPVSLLSLHSLRVGLCLLTRHVSSKPRSILRSGHTPSTHCLLLNILRPPAQANPS